MNNEINNVDSKSLIKVMIVDDDKFLLNMYALKFKANGYDIDTACGGEEALGKLRSGSKPNVLITDLIMPKMDGFAFVEEVKKSKLAEEATIIVLTNQGQSADIDKAVSLGVDGYIVKATTIPSEVVEEVKNIHAKKVNGLKK
jgi:CheY-like chemotaxis protein